MSFRLQSLWFRLLLGFGLPLLLFVGAALISSVTIQRLLTALHNEQHSQQIIAKAYDLSGALMGMEAVKRAHHLLGDQTYREEYDGFRNDFLNELARLRELSEDRPEYQEKLSQIAALEAEWRALAANDFETFSNRDDLAAQDLTQVVAKLQLREGIALVDRARTRISNLIKAENERLETNTRIVRQASQESVWIIGAASMLAILLSIAITFVLARSITRPIGMLHEAADRLRNGRFVAMPPSGPEELRGLISTFNMMGMALSEREDVLQTAEARYRVIVGEMSQILWTMNSDGEVMSELVSFSTVTGQPREETRGVGWLNSVHPDDRITFMDRWKQAVEKGKAYEDEIRIRASEGSYRHFVCRVAPVPGAYGDASEWVCSCTDVTERKAQEELRKQKEAAEAASRAKSEFLAKMSHELRTPLNAIIGMSKMLATQRFGELNEKQVDYLTDVTKAGEHLLSLINDILDLSKVEAGRMNLTPERIPLGETLAMLLSTVRGVAESGQLHLRFDPPEPDGEITTDLARFKQILYNLISNAVKFNRPQGSVTLRCQWVDRLACDAAPVDVSQAKAVRLEIEDTGIGIEKKYLESIWKEFSQVNPGASHSTEGTGLGLALTRRLTHLLKGVISVRSEFGHGSVFTVTLPLHVSTTCNGQDGRPSTNELNVTQRDGGRPVALVIDDYQPTNKLLVDWLENAELEACSSFDGADGLEKARQLLPDLIILDLRLPRLDGWHVLRELQADSKTREIPVIILSVLEGRQSPSELDIVDWLVKPVDHDQFMGRLRAAVPSLFNQNRKLQVLLVDDDRASRRWLCERLEKEGIVVSQADGGADAIEQLNSDRPDLIILELMLPDMDGFAVIEAVRENADLRELPILVVTAKDITAEDWSRLSGNIDAILRKDALTSEAFYRRLRSIGVTVNGR